MDFKSPSEQLPPPNTMVFIKRQHPSGKTSVYLGYRNDRPLTTNPDPSKDCFWIGNNIDTLEELTTSFPASFSDVTVIGWASLTSVYEKAEKMDKLDRELDRRLL